MFFSFTEDGCFYCPRRFDDKIARVLDDRHRWNRFGLWTFYVIFVVRIFYLIGVGAFLLMVGKGPMFVIHCKEFPSLA